MAGRKAVVRFRERYPTLPLRVEDGAPGDLLFDQFDSAV